MKEVSFLYDIVTTVLGCGEYDIEKTIEVVNETGEEIYNDFLEELSYYAKNSRSEYIDPVAIVYESVLRSAKSELYEIIDDAIEWYKEKYKEKKDEDKDKDEDDLYLYSLDAEIGKAIEDVYVYGNFADTQYDSTFKLSDLLEKIKFQEYIESNNIEISNTLKFFLNKII